MHAPRCTTLSWLAVTQHQYICFSQLMSSNPVLVRLESSSESVSTNFCVHAVLTKLIFLCLLGRRMICMYPLLPQTIRSALNDNVNPADYANPTAVRLGSALVPGIMMTPVSSVLGESSFCLVCMTYYTTRTYYTRRHTCMRRIIVAYTPMDQAVSREVKFLFCFVSSFFFWGGGVLVRSPLF